MIGMRDAAYRRRERMMLQQTTVRFSDEASACKECGGQGFTFHEGKIQNPSKFESEPLATYHAYHVMLEGGDDESDGSVWLIGNMVCEESEQGFVTCCVFDTDEAAIARWEEVEGREQCGQC